MNVFIEFTRENLEFCKKHLKPVWADGLTVENANEIFIELNTMSYGAVRASRSVRKRLVVELEHLKELVLLPCEESRKAYLTVVGKIITYYLQASNNEWGRVIKESVPYAEYYPNESVH